MRKMRPNRMMLSSRRSFRSNCVRSPRVMTRRPGGSVTHQDPGRIVALLPKDTEFHEDPVCPPE